MSKFGGNLVSIPSPQLNRVITEKMKNKEHLGHLWIGLTKRGRLYVYHVINMFLTGYEYYQSRVQGVY